MNEKPSTSFERQIERIHKLLEAESSQVTWNDRIPDPDNQDQLRQIDISIKRGDATVHVECRIHRSAQDVQWIEELIGRRISLHVDAIVAVSSSGFTEGAIKKAARHKIALHTLHNLSDQEVRLWARPLKVAAVFYKFEDCLIAFKLPLDVLPGDPQITSEDGKPIPWREPFEQIMKYCEDNDLGASAEEFEVELFAPVLVCGVKPLEIVFRGKIRRITIELPLDEVLCYTAIGENEIARVQKNADNTTEIIQTSGEALVVYDATLFTLPENCLFKSIDIDFCVPTLLKWVKFIEPQLFLESPIPLRQCFILAGQQTDSDAPGC